MDIKKAKFNKNGGVEIEYDLYYTTDEGSDYRSCKMSGRDKIHKDLSAAVSDLKPHVVMYAEFANDRVNVLKEWDKYCNGEKSSLNFSKIEITSVKFLGSGIHEGVQITINRILKNGMKISCNIPTIRFSDELPMDEVYQHGDVVKSICEDIKEQLELYISGKIEGNKQLVFDFETSVSKEEPEAKIMSMASGS